MASRKTSKNKKVGEKKSITLHTGDKGVFLFQSNVLRNLFHLPQTEQKSQEDFM